MVSNKSIQLFVKASGVKSILHTKPQRFEGINISELKLAPKHTTDTFVKKVESWFDSADHVKPYCERGKTMVEGHHNFHAVNDDYNKTLESTIKEIET